MKKNTKDKAKIGGASAALGGAALGSSKVRGAITSSRLVRKLASRTARKKGLAGVGKFSNRLNKVMKGAKYAGPAAAVAGAGYLGYRGYKKYKGK